MRGNSLCNEAIIPFEEKVFVKGYAREYDEVKQLNLFELKNKNIYVSNNFDESAEIVLGGKKKLIAKYKKKIWLTVIILILSLILIGIFAVIFLFIGLRS